MSTIYGQYLSMLSLVMKLSSILLKLRVNSELSLLNDVKCTVSDRYTPTIIFNNNLKILNQIQEIK